jgi:dUTP pyrophosphatase
MNVLLGYKRLTKYAFTPYKATDMAAGYDLFAAHDSIVYSKKHEKIKTDLELYLPDGCYGRLAPRSGLAWKHYIQIEAGVIDADFRGNVTILMLNLSESDFIVNRGDRIAQLICEKVEYPELCEIINDEDDVKLLKNKKAYNIKGNRQTDGFGSTGT